MLPAGQHLDGEIHAGRGGFKVASNAVLRDRWLPSVRFVAFDAPTAPGTWAGRMATVPGALAVEFSECRGMNHMVAEFRRVQAALGEGLILRDPKAVGYRPGRSREILKVKHLDPWL